MTNRVGLGGAKMELTRRQEIDKVEDGTYNTATKGIYEPAKSWIPGNSTIVTESVHTNKEN